MGAKLEAAIEGFDFGGADYALDESAGRVRYFYHDPEKWEKRILPVKRK